MSLSSDDVNVISRHEVLLAERTHYSDVMMNVRIKILDILCQYKYLLSCVQVEKKRM
jgi:hypothetical protein